jgi:hypothetical protein
VTTRASDLTTLGLGFGHGLEIETFTAEQGALFVLHRAGLLALDATIDQVGTEEEQQARNLSKELGGLPLALDQAGVLYCANAMHAGELSATLSDASAAIAPGATRTRASRSGSNDLETVV